VDCDDDANKPFCGSMGVKGFPTLKIVKPGSKPGKPIVEDYQGARTAKAIVETVTDKIPNLVKRVDDKSLEKFLAENNETAKAILFSEKGKTSSLIKAVAIEFKGSIAVAQIRNTEKAALELFGVDKFPTLILLPGGPEAEGIVFKDPSFNKESIVRFLSQAAEPNPDPAPVKVKIQKSKDSKKKQAEFESASSAHAKEDASTAGATATEEVLEEEPTESPEPIVEAEKPIVLPDPAPPIPILSGTELEAQCLGPKTGTCILALLPNSPDEVAAKAVGSLSEVSHRHHTHQRSLFPFYVLPEANAGYEKIEDALGLKGFEVIAINAKRGWWRALPKDGAAIAEIDVSEEAIERWVDSIRLGEGAKQKLPEDLVPEEPVVETPEEPVKEATEEPAAAEQTIVVEPVEEVKEDVHDEL
jgi:protein disulfide-isomerase A6